MHMVAEKGSGCVSSGCQEGRETIPRFPPRIIATRSLDRVGKASERVRRKSQCGDGVLLFESFETSTSFRLFDVFALGKRLIGRQVGWRVDGGWVDSKE
jgi:hypothetical protein